MGSQITAIILEILGVVTFLNLQSWSHTADGQEDFMALGGAEGRAGPGGVGINFLKGQAFIFRDGSEGFIAEPISSGGLCDLRLSED